MRFLPILLIATCLLTLFECPAPKPDDIDPVNCDDGYHPCGPDSQECCLDTTSHEFSWKIDTLGMYGSYLKDVVIINEDDIWVVGHILMPDPDSSYDGSGIERFNSARWNGIEWEILSIETRSPFGNYLIRGKLETIHYFSENDVWVTGEGYPIHWDGVEWRLYQLHVMGLNVSAGLASWGTSSQNMYFVGINGGIAHYDGSSFTKMESNTYVDLKDISGSPDGEHVFVTGYTVSGEFAGHSVVLRLVNDVWETLYYDIGYWPHGDSSGAVLGVSVYGDKAYFSRTGGLWRYNFTNGQSIILPANENGFDQHGYAQVIINNLNDIFIKDLGFSLLHYNGHTWKSDVSNNDYFGWFGVHSNRFAYFQNLIVMAGSYSSADGGGIVIMGTR